MGGGRIEKQSPPFHQSFQAQRRQGEGRDPDVSLGWSLFFLGGGPGESSQVEACQGGPSEGEDCQDLALCWTRGGSTKLVPLVIKI